MTVLEGLLLVGLLSTPMDDSVDLSTPPPDAFELSIENQDPGDVEAIQYKQRAGWPNCPSIDYYSQILASPEWRRCGLADRDWEEHGEVSSGAGVTVFSKWEVWIAKGHESAVVVRAHVSVPDGSTPEGEQLVTTRVFIVRGAGATQALLHDLFGRECSAP